MGHQQSSTSFLLFAQCHWDTTYSVSNDTLLLPANKRCINTGYSKHDGFTLHSIWENTAGICLLQNHFCCWSITGMEHYSLQLKLAFRLSSIVCRSFITKLPEEVVTAHKLSSHICSVLIPLSFHLLQTTYLSLGRSENCPMFGFCYSSLAIRLTNDGR